MKFSHVPVSHSREFRCALTPIASRTAADTVVCGDPRVAAPNLRTRNTACLNPFRARGLSPLVVRGGKDIVTRVRSAERLVLAALLMAFAGTDAALAQASLTLEDAIKRAQDETADARALASAIDEADARIQGAQ